MNHETFESWIAAVDSHLIRQCGMVHDDLPDCCYTDWYADGVEPKGAARRAIRNAKES